MLSRVEIPLNCCLSPTLLRPCGCFRAVLQRWFPPISLIRRMSYGRALCSPGRCLYKSQHYTLLLIKKLAHKREMRSQCLYSRHPWLCFIGLRQRLRQRRRWAHPLSQAIRSHLRAPKKKLRYQGLQLADRINALFICRYGKRSVSADCIHDESSQHGTGAHLDKRTHPFSGQTSENFVKSNGVGPLMPCLLMDQFCLIHREKVEHTSR